VGAQLDPHFLFNALNTVAMLVRRGARDDALHGVVALSGLLRRVLDGAGAAEATLGDELAIVEHYLDVERLRFRDRLQVRVDVPAELRAALVPPLVLQPLVENAMRHGAGHVSTGGVVEIRARRDAGDEGALVLEVHDDGPGFPKHWDPVAAGGLGLRTTRERLAHTYGGAARLEIECPDVGGAVVRIVVPLAFGDQID
jgi:LytS/YehU family sensor histidine kinase